MPSTLLWPANRLERAIHWIKGLEMKLPFVVTFPEYKNVLLIWDLEISEHHAPSFWARGIFEETSPAENSILKAAYQYPWMVIEEYP